MPFSSSKRVRKRYRVRDNTRIGTKWCLFHSSDCRSKPVGAPNNEIGGLAGVRAIFQSRHCRGRRSRYPAAVTLSTFLHEIPLAHSLASCLTGWILHASRRKRSDREAWCRRRAKMGCDSRWIYNDIDRGFAEAKKTGNRFWLLRCVPCLAYGHRRKHSQFRRSAAPF